MNILRLAIEPHVLLQWPVLASVPRTDEAQIGLVPGLLIGLGGLIVAAISSYFTLRSARSAATSAESAVEANKIAERASKDTVKANELTTQTNRILAEANSWAVANAEQAREFEITRDQISALEHARTKVLRHKERFEDRRVSLQEVIKTDFSTLDEDEIVPHARTASRSFRAAMRRYGEARTLYQEIRCQLDPSTAKEVDEKMRHAAVDFSERFDHLAAIVTTHREALRELEQVLSRTVQELREQRTLGAC